jgi:thiosulfate dehydrogenase (quinone) large subunit
MSHEEPSRPTNKLALIYGALLLRLWLAVRAIQTGIEKFSAQIGSEELVKIGGEPNDYGLTAGEKVKVYGLDHYHGVPEPMMKKFEKEPLMLKFGLPLYDKILGPALLLSASPSCSASPAAPRFFSSACFTSASHGAWFSSTRTTASHGSAPT